MMRPSLWQSSELETLIKRFLDEFKVPGLAIAVIDGDEILIQNFGSSRLPQISVNDKTIFDTASCSKSFTAAAIALIVEDSEKYPNIQWTTRVSAIIPDDFVLTKEYLTQHVTIEDILSHRSGIARHDDSPLGINSSTPDTPRSVTRNLRNLAFSRGLREEFQYSNLMYTAASHLVETVTDESFGKFLKRRIWDPLGMEHTYHELSGVQQSSRTDDLAKPYRWDETSNTFVELPWLVQPEGQGSGSIFSCVEDYAKWLHCMIKRSPPFSEESHKEFVKPRIIVDPEENEERRKRGFSHLLYALGWDRETYRGKTVIGHDGSVPGFGSMMKYLPDLEWGVVVFGNSNGTGEAAQALCRTLIDDLLQVPEDERTEWRNFIKEEERSWKEELKDDPFEEDGTEYSEGLSLEHYVGQYHNQGYHDLCLRIKDGDLFADCSEHSFPFELTLRHHSGQWFATEMYDVLDAEVLRKMKAVFEVEGERVIRLGISIVEEMPDEIVWFERVK